MKLEEAIERASEIAAERDMFEQYEDAEALKLLIEAGKRCLLARKETSFIGPGPLPGETFECCKFCGVAHTGLECPDRGGRQ